MQEPAHTARVFYRGSAAVNYKLRIGGPDARLLRAAATSPCDRDYRSSPWSNRQVVRTNSCFGGRFSRSHVVRGEQGGHPHYGLHVWRVAAKRGSCRSGVLREPQQSRCGTRTPNAANRQTAPKPIRWDRPQNLSRRGSYRRASGRSCSSCSGACGPEFGAVHVEPGEHTRTRGAPGDASSSETVS